MDSERLCDALCRLAGPVSRMAEDAAVQEAIAELLQTGLSKQTPAMAWGMLIGTLTPLLLGRHREDMLSVAAALLDERVEKLRGESGLVLMAALRDCWDEELAGFFASAADMDGKKCSA